MTKLLLTGLAAAICMGLAAGAASAGRLSSSSATFRFTWSSLRFEEESGGFASTCSLTLEGSFHSSTISKIASATIGAVTRGTGGRCSGEATAVSVAQETLPWRVSYQSFTGTLPNITGVNVGFRPPRIIQVFGGIQCLFQKVLLVNRLSIGAGGAISGIEPEGALWVLVVGVAPPCPLAIRVGGAGRASVLGSTTSVSMRLI